MLDGRVTGVEECVDGGTLHVHDEGATNGILGVHAGLRTRFSKFRAYMSLIVNSEPLSSKGVDEIIYRLRGRNSFVGPGVVIFGARGRERYVYLWCRGQ